MYNFYPITSLKEWYLEYGSLLREKDIWKNQEWVLFHHKMISEYLKKEILEKDGISFAPFVMESVEPSFFFWLSRLVSQDKIQPIVEERTLFILLYLANKKINLLEGEGKTNLNLLKKIATLFFYYERENSPLLEEWKKNPLDINNLDQEEKSSQWQRILWQFIFLDSQRDFLSLIEALENLREREIKRENFPFSSLIAFTDYNLNKDIFSFLSIMEKKGWETHHIAFLPSFYAISSKEKIRPFFYENWIKPYFYLKNKIQEIPHLKENLPDKETYSRNLLGYLKKIIKYGQEEKEEVFISLEDKSFLLIESLTPLREIEVISDKILESLVSGILLEEMTLLIHEKDLYYPIVEKVLKDKNIPFNLQGKRNENEDSLFIKAISNLLLLGENHFSKEEIFSLFENPVILSQINSSEEDLDLFKLIVKETNVLYGFDKEHKEKQGFPSQENNTWKKAFERIYLGLVTFENQNLKTKPPINISLLEWNRIQPFIKLTSQLYKDISQFSRNDFSLQEWINSLERFFSFYLGMDHPEAIILRKTFSYIEKITKNLSWEGSPLHEQPLSFSFFKMFFEEVLSSFIPSAPKDKKGIKIGSYQTLGVIPHSVTFVCGMNHKNLFPKSHDNLDLHLKNKREQQNCDSIQEEREDFLRVLFQTEKRLILSYTKEDPLKSEKTIYIQDRPPFLNEILNFLQEESPKEPFYWTWESENPLSQIIENHLYWEFDKRYFINNYPLSSFNEKAFLIAQKKEDYKKSYELDNKEENISLERASPKPYNWNTLRYLLTNPYEKYFKEILRINLNKINSSFEVEDHLEDYDPSPYSWLSYFWEKMEEVNDEQERIISSSAWENWGNIFQDLIEKEYHKDSFENNIYTSFNKKEWQIFLEETNFKIKDFLPLKRENINFQEGLEKEDVGKWINESFSLEGVFPYDIFRKEGVLFLVTYKTLYSEDLFLILIFLSLYKYHIHSQKSDFIFKEFIILQASLSSKLPKKIKRHFLWDQITEEPLEIIQKYGKLSHKKPFPFYFKTIESIISLKDSQNLSSKEIALKLKKIFQEEESTFNQHYYPKCLYLKAFPWSEDSLEKEDFELFLKIHKVYKEMILSP